METQKTAKSYVGGFKNIAFRNIAGLGALGRPSKHRKQR